MTVANTPEDRRDHVDEMLLRWGMSTIIVAPVTTWEIFVTPAGYECGCR